MTKLSKFTCFGLLIALALAGGCSTTPEKKRKDKKRVVPELDPAYIAKQKKITKDRATKQTALYAVYTAYTQYMRAQDNYLFTKNKVASAITEKPVVTRKIPKKYPSKVSELSVPRAKFMTVKLTRKQRSELGNFLNLKTPMVKKVKLYKQTPTKPDYDKYVYVLAYFKPDRISKKYICITTQGAVIEVRRAGKRIAKTKLAGSASKKSRRSKRRGR